MEKFIPYGKLSKSKSARLTQPGALPGVHSIPSPASRKTARHTTETNPGIGNVKYSKPIPGIILCGLLLF